MREFAVTPPSKSTWVLMILLVVVLPCILFVTGLVIARQEATTLPVAPFAFLPLILVAIGAGLGWSMRRARLRVGNGRWRLEAAWYTQDGNLSEVDAATLQIVDLKARRDLRPWLRSNGIGLPGFQAGHFRYWKGGKAFLMLTDASRVLAFRERSGRQLLVSLERPQDALKALAGE